MGKNAVYEPASKVADMNWGHSSKQMNFGPSSRKEEMKKEEKKENPYGAWGPIFKNKEHFASLHHC